MKTFKITVLVVALALLGGTFTIDAKVKKRRSTTKKEKIVQQKNKTENCVKVEQCGLDMVEYVLRGMRESPMDLVRVERKDGNVVLVIKGTMTDEKEYVINDGEQILKEALEIIEQEEMLKYASNYYPDPSVVIHDGNAWSFKAKLADGRSVSSKGRNASPDGKGLSKIRDLLFGRAEKLLD